MAARGLCPELLLGPQSLVFGSLCDDAVFDVRGSLIDTAVLAIDGCSRPICFVICNGSFHMHAVFKLYDSLREAAFFMSFDSLYNNDVF